MTTIVREPGVDERPEQIYMGLRRWAPMRGFSKAADQLFKDMRVWVKDHNLQRIGPPLLRYYVIDMQGEMDVEVCIPVAAVLPDEGGVCAGVIPAGRYASLVYTGAGITGNRVLIEWARAQGLKWDRWDDPKGDAFHARYEAYLTDPKDEPRKTKWEVEVVIKLAD